MALIQHLFFLSVCAVLIVPGPEKSAVEGLRGGRDIFPTVARADTVRAGDVFITNLPDSLAGVAVERYKGITLPGRSWLLKYSFFWQTQPSDVGEYKVVFRAFLETGQADSLSIDVVVI